MTPFKRLLQGITLTLRLPVANDPRQAGYDHSGQESETILEQSACLFVSTQPWHESQRPQTPKRQGPSTGALARRTRRQLRKWLT